MKTRALLLVGLILGGAAVAAELESKPASAGVAASMSMKEVPPTPLPPIAPKAVLVAISSATLGEDCGESPEPAPEPKPSKSKSQLKPTMDAPAAASERSVAGARARRACEQTSMQLSVRSGAEAATASITVKQVEIYDDKGKLIGTLKPRGPSVWSAASSTYQAWDEKSVPGADLMTRYVLTAPDWSKVKNRWDRSYTIKAIVTVGGADQKVEREVWLQSETQLPPGVVT